VAKGLPGSGTLFETTFLNYSSNKLVKKESNIHINPIDYHNGYLYNPFPFIPGTMPRRKGKLKPQSMTAWTAARSALYAEKEPSNQPNYTITVFRFGLWEGYALVKK
jgi:hypothetical protein